jgi:hypothetical protein
LATVARRKKDPAAVADLILKMMHLRYALGKHQAGLEHLR